MFFLHSRKRKHLKSGLSRPTLPGLVTVGGLLLPAHVQVVSFGLQWSLTSLETQEALSSDDDRASINLKQSDQELEEEEMEGPFSFKRKAGVEYHPVLEEEEAEEETPYHLLVLPGGVGGRRADTCIGYGRRRLGRGGRLVLDRIPWRGGGDDLVVQPRTPPAHITPDWDPYRPRGVMAGV